MFAGEESSLLSAGIGFAGAILGAGIAWLANHLTQKGERQDKARDERLRMHVRFLGTATALANARRSRMGITNAVTECEEAALQIEIVEPDAHLVALVKEARDLLASEALARDFNWLPVRSDIVSSLRAAYRSS